VRYKKFMKLLLNTVSHVERLEEYRQIIKEIAKKLRRLQGVAARASGINDDIRKSPSPPAV